MTEVDAIEHADWPRRHIVAAADPNPGVVHRRVDQPHGQLAFQVGAQAADGFHHQRQVRFRRDSQAPHEGGLNAGAIQPCLDLRTGAKSHHQANTEAAEQGNVVDDVDEIAMGDGVAGNGQHHGPAPVGVDVGR